MTLHPCWPGTEPQMTGILVAPSRVFWSPYRGPGERSHHLEEGAAASCSWSRGDSEYHVTLLALLVWIYPTEEQEHESLGFALERL